MLELKGELGDADYVKFYRMLRISTAKVISDELADEIRSEIRKGKR